MDKPALLRQIIERLEADRAVIAGQLQAAHEAATHAESKAENKYDTRGLEAAYLADGQRRRLHEIEAALAAFRLLGAAPPGAAIRLGALVCLGDAEGERWLFLGPDGAGLKIRQGDCEVLVISPRSPLGQALPGRVEGDEVSVRVDGRECCYEVLAVR